MFLEGKWKQMSQQKISSLRKEKASVDDLSTRMIVPNPTNKKIHFEPFYMMEFRDAQSQSRFLHDGGQFEGNIR